MLREWIAQLQKNPKSGDVFFSAEVILAGLFAFGFWLVRPKSPESQFKVREADLKGASPSKPRQNPGEDPLANARITKQEPLRLGGIRIDGKAHEILGVSLHATPEEIQSAYRELMKRYHPDRVGPQDSPQWKDAQKIAEAINRAKTEMLSEKHSKKKS